MRKSTVAVFATLAGTIGLGLVTLGTGGPWWAVAALGVLALPQAGYLALTAFDRRKTHAGR